MVTEQGKRMRQPQNILTFITLAAIAVLAGCTSVGERTQLSVGYYTVAGETFSDLDRQILLHGPDVSGVGKALAATNIRMVPDVKVAIRGDTCVVESARITVRAKVTLPRHARLYSLKKEVRAAWDNMEEYARVHEAVHVTIADKYALKIEQKIKQIPPQDTCNELREKVLAVSTGLLKDHEREQLAFDRDEQSRIRALVDKSVNASNS